MSFIDLLTATGGAYVTHGPEQIPDVLSHAFTTKLDNVLISS